jgi:hypothetical protein
MPSMSDPVVRGNNEPDARMKLAQTFALELAELSGSAWLVSKLLRE